MAIELEAKVEHDVQPARRVAFRGNGLLFFGLLVVAVSIALAVFGPTLAPYNPVVPTGRVTVPPPSFGEVPGLLASTIRGQLEQPVHWFGTDSTGLDVFSRVISAPRVDVSIALAATLLSLLAGAVLGLLAGFFRGWWSEGLMRVSDVIQSFPAFVLAMILVAMAGRRATNIVVVLGVLYTPIYTRLTRSAVLAERARSYVEASRALGNRELVTAVRHVLPNSLTPALVQASVTVGWAILLTAGISFVGAGVRPPTPEWGIMIATGANGIILGHWWPSVFPGIAISLVVFGYAILGNALEQRFGH